MRYACKTKKKRVKAYCLGTGSEMETLLLQEGTIRLREDGQYELFSQEAVHGGSGIGQIARAGDYFKVDTIEGRHYPYPNSREFFQENHTHLEGDWYEQKSKPVAFWQVTDPLCEEISYLLETKKLLRNPENPAHYFQAVLWGSQLSAAKDATIIFYEIDRNETGKIEDIRFNFVTAADFNERYEICASSP